MADIKILNVAAALKAQGQESIPRNQIPALTGIESKKTIANALTKVKRNGWIIVTPQEITITDEGFEHGDPNAVDIAIPQTNEAHIAIVKERLGSKPHAVAIIDFLSDGMAHEKKELIDALRVKPKTLANLLTGLKKDSIVTFDRTTIQLHDDMFPFGRP